MDDPQLVSVYHGISIEGRTTHKENVAHTFLTEWRGQEVTVNMDASRYTYTEGGLTEWRIYASRAYLGTSVTGSMVTELARARLSERLMPLVEAWLASDAYAPSAQKAWINAVARIASDMRHDSRDLRAAIYRYRDRIGDDAARRLTQVADAFDVFQDTLKATSS